MEGAHRHRDRRRHRLDRDDAHLHFRSGDDIRPGSTGRAVPGYEATVLDADGQPMAEGEGRLAVKGPTGCRYLDDPRQRDYVATAGTSPATPTARTPTAIIGTSRAATT